jgi:hypothetical protein
MWWFFKWIKGHAHDNSRLNSVELVRRGLWEGGGGWLVGSVKLAYSTDQWHTVLNLLVLQKGTTSNQMFGKAWSRRFQASPSSLAIFLL